MMIEVAPGAADEHEGDTGFDQTPGQEGFAAHAVIAIELPGGDGFLLNIECLLGASG